LEPASRLNARVDRDLDAILATALRPDPEERYSSADVLANELGRWRRHEPIVIRTRGAGWAPAYHRADRLRLWRRRHPIVAPLVATVIALAAAGSAGIGWNWWQLTRARAELELTQYVERVELAGRELAVNNVPRARALLESCPPRWRGWEWRARRAECEADPLDLRVGSPSLGVTISREAARVAAVGLDGSVHCWDASTGRPAWSRSPYRGPARAAAFSPDGSLIAVAGGNFDGTRDAAVRILEASTGRERSVFRIEGLNPWSVAWSPDGRTVAYAGGGKSFGKAGALGLIDPDTGELRRSLPGHAGRVWSVAFSGTRAGLLASAGDDGTVRIWRAADGTGVTVFRSSGDPAFSVAFAPDDRTIAAGGGRHNLGDSGWLRDWNLASGSVRRFDGHTDEVWSVAFHPDGHRLASASKDRTVKVWDLASAREALTLYDHLDHARGVAWAGDTLVSTGEDGRVRVRGGADRPATGTRLPGHPARVWKAAFSRDGRHLVAGAQDGVVVVWDVRRRTVSRRLAGHAGPVRDVAFSPDGRWLASASYDDTVHLRTWPDGATRFVLADAGAGWVHAVAFRPDGARLAAASNYGFTLWRTGDGRRVPSPQGHHWIVSAAAWTPDGRLLVTAGWDQIVLLHREVGTTPVALRGHQGRIQDLAISPDGRRLATAGNDGMIRIWDLPTGRRRLAIRDHTGAVLDVTWSRDGRRLVSAGRDQTVRLWEAESGEELARWRGHPGLVRAVALSPVEPLLAVVSGGDVSGGITLWPLPEARSTPRTP
jgi:WD40 repeat protein